MTDTEYKIFDKDYKTPFNVRLERQWESAERREPKRLWSFHLFKKMVEEESKYDADVITFLKDEIRKFDERLKQWKLEND